MNLQNNSQIYETEYGDILQVAILTGIRDARRRAVLVSKSLIACTGIEQEVATMEKSDIDKLYEGLEDLPEAPSDPKIITP